MHTQKTFLFFWFIRGVAITCNTYNQNTHTAHVESLVHLMCMALDCGGNRRTWRKPTLRNIQMLSEEQQDSNQELLAVRGLLRQLSRCVVPQITSVTVSYDTF